MRVRSLVRLCLYGSVHLLLFIGVAWANEPAASVGEPGCASASVGEPGCASSTLDSKVRTIVFVSLGMPTDTLRYLVRDSAEHADTLLVLRGWTPPDMVGLFRRIHELQPEGKQANVMLHPVLFRRFKVESVPVFVHRKSADAPWRRLEGDSRLEQAVARLEQDPDEDLKRPAGKLHKIEEPDILTLIATRIKGFDWNTMIAHGRERVRARVDAGIDVPVAKVSRSYVYDPSIIVTAPIRTTGGIVLAEAGQRLNPFVGLGLDLPFRYAVLDPTRPEQRKIVDTWLADHPGTVVLVTRGLGEAGQHYAGSRLYPVVQSVLDRMGVTEIPALVKRDGDKLHVDVVAP